MNNSVLQTCALIKSVPASVYLIRAHHDAFVLKDEYFSKDTYEPLCMLKWIIEEDRLEEFRDYLPQLEAYIDKLLGENVTSQLLEILGGGI